MNQKIFLSEKMLDCSTKTCNVSFNLNNYSLVFEKKINFRSSETKYLAIMLFAFPEQLVIHFLKKFTNLKKNWLGQTFIPLKDLKFSRHLSFRNWKDQFCLNCSR